MYDNFNKEVDVAMASIDDLTLRKGKELQDLIEVMEIAERSATIGITMDEAKFLVKQGVDIDLDELNPGRTHLGNESQILTESGKVGLYGLAIGALVAVLGFIVTKLFKWFKGTSSGGTGSGKSNKDLEKTVPSMGSKPSSTMKIPSVLADPDDFNDFVDQFDGYLSFAQLFIKEVGEETNLTDSQLEAWRKRFVSETNKLGYKLGSGDDVSKLKEAIESTDIEDLPYGKIKPVEVHVNEDKIEMADKYIKSYNKVEKELDAMAKKKGESKASMTLLKTLTPLLVKVLQTNFSKVVQLVGRYNQFITSSTNKYIKACETKALQFVANDKDTKVYFINVDFTDADSVEKAFEKCIAGGKTASVAVRNFIAYKEEIEKFEKYMQDFAAGETSSGGEKKKKK